MNLSSLVKVSFSCCLGQHRFRSSSVRYSSAGRIRVLTPTRYLVGVTGPVGSDLMLLGWPHRMASSTRSQPSAWQQGAFSSLSYLHVSRSSCHLPYRVFIPANQTSPATHIPTGWFFRRLLFLADLRAGISADFGDDARLVGRAFLPRPDQGVEFGGERGGLVPKLPKLVYTPWGYLPQQEALQRLEAGVEVPAETNRWSYESNSWETIYWQEPGVLEEYLGLNERQVTTSSGKTIALCVECSQPGRWRLQVSGESKHSLYCEHHLRKRIDSFLSAQGPSLASLRVRGPYQTEE